jgi:excisionase family DNA binding protein
MTPRQAATLIGCSNRHVRSLIKSGKLLACSVPRGYGYSWDITASSVELFLDLPSDGRGWPRGKARNRKRAKR